MININNVSKSYRIPIRESGFFAALKAFVRPRYRDVHALSNVDLRIEAGEIVGYIGPNGAGKSTTIKILSGILRPDEGDVSVNGLNPFTNRKQHAQQIGVLFGQRSQLWWDLPVADSFNLVKEIYKIPNDTYQIVLDEYVEMFDLSTLLQTPVRQLSLGQRVKCDIVAALLHQPKVLFLDEPTLGLDATTKQIVRKLIRKINRKYRTTIVVTSHDMQDIEQIVDRVILIGNGRKLYDGALSMLIKDYGEPQKIVMDYEGQLEASDHFTILENEDNHAILRITTTLALALDAMHHHLKIQQLEVMSTTIDEVILNLYKEHNI